MTRSFRVVRPAWVVAWTVAAPLAALTGCGGSDEAGAPTAKRAATPTPAATLPEEVKGSWTRQFKPREVELEGAPAGT